MILTDLLARPEGKTLEFKRDLSSPDGVLRTLAAFANTGGGTVLIGVEDTTRHVRGVADPLTQEERLANLVSDLIAPRLIPEIELLRWRGTHVLAVQVYPSAARPHHLRREGEDNGTYVRIGSTNRRADTALIAEMRRYARAESYDEQPVPELGPQAIDFRAACECFAAVRKLARRDLETLRLVTTHQGRRVPTVGGVLLFGHDRGRQFPEAWIQAGTSPAPTGAGSSIRPSFASIRCPRSRQRSRSCTSICFSARRSARCAAKTAGACLRWRFARP